MFGLWGIQIKEARINEFVLYIVYQQITTNNLIARINIRIGYIYTCTMQQGHKRDFLYNPKQVKLYLKRWAFYDYTYVPTLPWTSVDSSVAQHVRGKPRVNDLLTFYHIFAPHSGYPCNYRICPICHAPLICRAPQHFSQHISYVIELTNRDAINQRCCPQVGDRGVDLNVTSSATHHFCACAVHGKSDIYGILNWLLPASKPESIKWNEVYDMTASWKLIHEEVMIE